MDGFNLFGFFIELLIWYVLFLKNEGLLIDVFEKFNEVLEIDNL